MQTCQPRARDSERERARAHTHTHTHTHHCPPVQSPPPGPSLPPPRALPPLPTCIPSFARGSRVATATASFSASKYQQSRRRVQELLEQSKKADWDSAAPCADAGEIANTPGEEALDLNSKGSMDSKREKGKWSGGGDTVGEVLMRDMSLDKLAVKASRYSQPSTVAAVECSRREWW